MLVEGQTATTNGINCRREWPLTCFQHFIKSLGFMGVLALLGSCTFVDSFIPKQGETTDVIDRQQNLTINDFRDLNNAKKLMAEKNDESKPVTPTAELGTPPIPDLAQVLAAPRPPKIANTKLVTLSVTEDVPLRDVLFELGRLAKVDIEVGPGLDKGGINLRATDRPFNEVIERIADLGALRYTSGPNSIRVEKDLPFIKSYSIDFLNIVRSSASSYTLSTSALSGGGGSTGGSAGGASSGGGVGTSGSSTSIDGKSESDLWGSLDASIKEIVAYSPTGAGATDAAGAASDAPAAAAGGGVAPAVGGLKAGSYVINRQAGLLTVNATDRQHEMIKRFLSLMTRNSSAQVLIEAKIVEVSLSDQFASGVDWSKVINGQHNSSLGLGQYLGINPATTSAITMGKSNNAATVFSISSGNSDSDLGAIVALTQTFGTTRTLSSPRLSAINNQQAVLTFARNEVFFDCTYTPAQTSSGTTTTSTSTDATLTCSKNQVPIGIILNILPSVDLDTQEVTLNVRPTLTRKVGDAINPTTGFLKSQAAAGAADSIPNITVPIIEVREIDSIAKIKSSGVMIIGGLMEDVTRNSENGVPGVGELPIFGNLFKSRSEDATKRELIIFVKATIVNSDGSTGAVDRAIYKKYTTDPRPLFPEQK